MSVLKKTKYHISCLQCSWVTNRGGRVSKKFPGFKNDTIRVSKIIPGFKIDTTRVSKKIPRLEIDTIRVSKIILQLKIDTSIACSDVSLPKVRVSRTIFAIYCSVSCRQESGYWIAKTLHFYILFLTL